MPTSTTYVSDQAETTHEPIFFLTTPETARYLGLAVSTLNKWRCIGDGPVFIKLGRAVRYRKEDLDAYVTKRSLASTSEMVGRLP